MISVVIRNKNEERSLARTLHILTSMYSEDISEIIVIDNLSIDDSARIAESYGAKVVTIEKFTYGKAINLGVSVAKGPYVLLLSSHAVPVGRSFFKNALELITKNKSIAGGRFVNSVANYERALKNHFRIKDGLTSGLMAACAIVSKDVWEKVKFDEDLGFSEDKAWSEAVLKEGYKLIEIPETFFYYPLRNSNAEIVRWKNETLAHYQLFEKESPSLFRILSSFLKKVLWSNWTKLGINILYEFRLLRAKIDIKRIIDKRNG